MSVDPPSWKLRRQTTRLERVIAESRGVWEDSAARDVRVRYLQPHEEEALAMAAALCDQEAHHVTAEAAVAVVITEGQVAADASDRCLRELREAEQQRMRAYDQVGIALRFAATSHGLAGEAEMHARDAMSACVGCPGDNGTIAPMLQISPAPAMPTAVASAPIAAPDVVLRDGVEWFDLDLIDLVGNPIVGKFGRGDMTKEDYSWGAQIWRDVVLPGLQRGMTKEDFEEADRKAGRDVGARRVAGVYEMFLGDDPIWVERRSNGTWQLGGGRHRVTVLREAGVRWAPVRIASGTGDG